MVVIKGINNYNDNNNTCVTIGTFDGVHLGHKKIFNTLTSIAKQNNLKSVVITFEPHPRKFLFPDCAIKYILSYDEKLQKFSETNIDYLIIQPFNREFASLQAENFLTKTLYQNLKMKHLVKGFNNHFGSDRLSDINVINQIGNKNGFKVTQVDAALINDTTISSSSIRKLIAEGNIESANTMLGYHYTISGKVIHGKMLGRTIGYPTANISTEDNSKLLPANGVYAAYTIYNNITYPTVLNIGDNPTVNTNDKKTFVEAHIMDFNNNIYDQYITINLISRIRNEIKFSNIEALKNQISIDTVTAKKSFYKAHSLP